MPFPAPPPPGPFASSGASIGLLADPGGLGNFTLNPAEPLTFVGGGTGGNGALVNLLGNNTVSNAIAPIGFATSIGSVAGTLTVTSDIVVGGTLTFAGAGNVNATGVISSGGAVTTNNALLAQWYNTPGLNEALTWADAASGGTPAANGLGPMGDDPNGGLPTQPAIGSNFLTGPLTFQGARASRIHGGADHRDVRDVWRQFLVPLERQVQGGESRNLHIRGRSKPPETTSTMKW